MTDRKDQALPPELIGQFGVGFYATFMVAERIVVVSRRAGEARATRWESRGEGAFTVEEAERESGGTSVTVYLKPVDVDDGIQDYTDEWVVREIVKKYSDFVAYPIRLPVERREIEKRGGREAEAGRHGTGRAARGDPQLHEGGLGPAQERGVGAGVQGILQAYLARLGESPGNHPGAHGGAV